MPYPQRLAGKIQIFQQALTRLQETLAEQENDIIRDAVIQRFEFTYELAWKVMKLWLDFKGIDARNPRDVLKEAFQQKLIDDGDAWLRLHEFRNLASHTYDETMVKTVVAAVRSFGFPTFVALIAKFAELELAS